MPTPDDLERLLEEFRDKTGTLGGDARRNALAASSEDSPMVRRVFGKLLRLSETLRHIEEVEEKSSEPAAGPRAPLSLDTLDREIQREGGLPT